MHPNEDRWYIIFKETQKQHLISESSSLCARPPQTSKTLSLHDTNHQDFLSFVVGQIMTEYLAQLFSAIAEVLPSGSQYRADVGEDLP